MMKQVLKSILNEYPKELKRFLPSLIRIWQSIGKPSKKLEQIPGIGKKSAEIILAEIGLRGILVPSAGHVEFMGRCSTFYNESAGKRKSYPNPQRK